MKKSLSTIFLLIILATIAKAQSDFDFTQRWFNETFYNPAAAGNSFTTGVFLHGRQQWLGMSKAPTTFAGTFDTYVSSIRSGFGLTLTSDRIGVTNRHNARLAYAFYIRTGDRSTLSLGLSAGVLVDSRKASDAIIEDPNDPELAYGNSTEYSPDFDFGLEFKGPLKLGLGVRHIGATNMSRYFPKHSINVWAYVSSRFNLSQSISIEPLLSGTYRNEIYRLEGGALVYFLKNNPRDTFNDRFWIGGVIRTGSNAAIMAGMHLTSKLRVGYSFDYGFGNVKRLSKYGSHEIFVAFQLDRVFYKEPLCPAYSNRRN